MAQSSLVDEFLKLKIVCVRAQGSYGGDFLKWNNSMRIAEKSHGAKVVWNGEIRGGWLKIAMDLRFIEMEKLAGAGWKDAKGRIFEMNETSILAHKSCDI